MQTCTYGVECVLVTKYVFIVHCVCWVYVCVFCTLSSVQSVFDLIWMTHRVALWGPELQDTAAVFAASSCGHGAPDLRDSSPNADRADRSSCGVTAAAALAHCVSLIFTWLFSSHVELLIPPHLISGRTAGRSGLLKNGQQRWWIRFLVQR